MKKIMLSLLCAGIALSASAQKSSVLLFGELGGQSATTTLGSGAGSTTATNFHFTPGVGYQFTDKWTFGVEGIVNYMNGTIPTTGASTSTTNAGGGLFARYSHPLAGVFSWYLQGDVTYTAGSTSSGGSTLPGSNSNTMGVGITPAVSVNLKNGFAINFGFGRLGFSYMNMPTPDVHTTTFDYNFFSGMNFGMSKNFAKKVKPAKKHSDVEGAEAE